MKLTKKLQAEILKVYNTVWDAYLRGDMRTFASILDENCYIIGSAAGEVFKNKKAAVKYYKSTAEQITGKAEFRNRKIKVMPVEKGFMVNEEADFYLLIDDQWTFYGPGRISSLFHKKNNKWKVVHQHGSFPDSKTEEGEQVNTDKIKAENIQLRDAVKRRTEELENTNRELEIEAALERVRARAMAMQSSDELIEVANVMRQQMVELGQSGFDTAAVHLYSDDPEYFDSWYSFRQGDPVTGKIVTGKTKFKKDACKMLREMVKAYHSKENDYTLKASGEKLREWFLLLKKTIPEIKINLDKNPGSNYIHFSDFSGGSLVMATFQPPTRDSMLLQKRCAVVFDLAYRRYIDLKKAEVQAREAGIELSLERVRAKAMAMQKPSEFVDVINIIGEQLIHLGFDIDWANFGANGFDISEGIDIWNFGVVPGASPISARVFFPYFDHPVFTTAAENVNEFLNGGRDLITVTLDKQAKDTWLDHMFTNTIFKDIPEEYRVIQYGKPGYTTSNISLKDTWLSIGKFDIKNFTDEQHAIFRRFANAFGQAYTRFLDLQNAEAQAKEAQIEAALERVRARSMAMHHSSELHAAADVLFQQLRIFGGDIMNAGIALCKQDADEDEYWLSSESGLRPVISIPHTEDSVQKKLYEDWKNKSEFFSIAKGGDELKAHYNYMQSVPGLKPFFKEGPDWSFPTWQKWHAAYFSHGYLFMITLKPYEEEKILVRFAKVFEQAYTRFLDLQKAEAQAREAQVEAGLERVRSRAMAMQSSEQLRELIGTVFIELTKLDIVLTRCLIMIYDPKSNDSVWWMANSEAPTQPIGLKVQYHELPSYLAYVNAWKQKELKWTYTLEGNIKKEWDDFLFVETELSHLPDFVIAGMKAPDRVYLNASFNSFGNLTLATLEPLSDEHFDIMLRFAKVFDLTYTRFNDLKQAEAQAREARIETALERVRAVAMAMRKPEDLMQISEIIYKQLQALDFANLRNVQIAIDDDEKKTYNGVEYSEFYQNRFKLVPYDSSPMFAEIAKEIKRSNNAFYQKEISGKEFEDWRIWRTNIKEREDSYIHPGLAAATSMCFYLHSVGTGMLGISTFNPIKDEQLDILKRFKNVFELSYRRYIDIEKAEAQTREAQIELALERVRARTMAMHKSEELAETSQVLFHQLSELGGIPDRISIAIIDEVNSVANFWSTDQQGSHLDHSFRARLNERTTIAKTYHAWKEQKRSLVIDLHGEELNEWIQFAREEMGIVVKDDQIKDRRVHTLAFFSQGWILVTSHEPQSTETIQILERFASVFNLTYRRFLDLQKAEAQANEARIEIALERIRARALAMHKSDELMEVANVLREQMALLGQPELESSVVHLYEEDPDNILSWRSFRALDPHSKIAYGHMAIPKNCCEVVREWLTKFHSELKEYTIEISGAKQEEWYEILFKLAPDVINSMRQENSIHEKRYYRFSKFSGGALLMVSKQEPSEEVTYLQKRAAVVFDLAYRRFADLQKAEAQAKESQIETALEKVRASAMAMHNSNDISSTTTIIFVELKKLGIQSIRCGIGLLSKKSPAAQVYAATTSPDNELATLRRLISMTDHPALQQQYESWLKQENYIQELKQDELRSYYQLPFFHSSANYIPPENFEQSELGYYIPFSEGVFYAWTKKAYSDDEINILNRFKTIVDLTFRRYLDLQKAEAQAREAQIEAALERVRSKTMAMHNSQDVGETVAVMFDELRKLDVETLRCGVGIMLENYQMELWTARPDATGKVEFIVGNIDMKLHPLLTGAYEAWKNRVESFFYELKDEDLKTYFDAINSHQAYAAKYDISSLPSLIFHYEFNFNEGCLFAFSIKQFSDESSQIFKRFTGVFGQTYRRFLDLQKAEAQAREAQIETSLERIRSRTMGMQKSNELGDVAALLSKELLSLGISQFASCGYVEIEEKNNRQRSWLTNPDGTSLEAFYLPLTGEHIFNERYDAWKRKDVVFKQVVHAKELKKHLDFSYSGFGSQESENVGRNFFPDPTIFYNCNFSYGYLSLITGVMLTQAEESLLARFTRVFEQTYSRFLDLQKAEAQAREAQIEASLERVRSKTMAMHNSQDVGDTVATMLDELVKLGVETVRCGIAIIDESKTMEVWTAYSKEDGGIKLVIGQLDMKTHPLFMQVYDAWKQKKTVTTYEMIGEDLKDYFRAINDSPNYSIRYDIETLPYRQSNTAFMFPEGSLFVFSQEPLVTETIQIFKRFAGVFGQTYRRYLDLLKAEANAREAQIEAGLERVRAKAMAMHSSKDLAETLSVFYRELKSLSVVPIRCGVALMDKESRMAELTTMNTTGEGDSIEIIGKIKMTGHPVLDGVFESWLVQKEYHAVLRGNQIKEYYQVLKPQIDYLDYSQDEAQFGYYFMFNEGDVYAWTEKELTEDELTIYRRFTTVISLTYKRYKDLQQAEAQAREAKIEAGLERVRSKTMAMHNSDDVTSATATMFTELDRLGIENMRCGIAHYLEDHKMEVWSVSNLADGKVVRGAGLLDTNSIPFWKLFYSTWQKKEDFLYYYMAGKEKEEYFKKISNVQNYLNHSIEDVPDLSIQTYYFPEGSVWAFSLKPHTEEDKQVMKRFASVFSLTFRRYQDLQKAEAQARESQIETGLERVRARTMAMHSSEDVSIATATMFTELEKLGIQNLRGGITIIKPGDKQEVWGVTNLPDGKTIRSIGEFDMHLHPLWRELLKAKVNNGDYNYYRLAGKDKEDYINILNATPNYLSQPIKDFPDVHVQSYFFGEGAIWTNSSEAHSEEQKQTMKRFASVFSLTFRRYQDLKKAEAQAREATIESALEKVRGKAMAMHNSNDLSTTASIVFTELRKLGISPIRCGVGLLNKESRKGQIYAAASSNDQDSLSLVGWVQLSGHPVLEKIYDTWKNNEDYFPELNGEQMKTYYDLLLSGLSVAVPDTGEKQYGTFLPFSVGCLYAWSETPYNDSELKILKRFASIIDLTFRRYIELQKSEATAKEAIKQAALDRIRADIASMRTINDLDRITPLIWNELTVLGIPFIRCGVFIMDEHHQLIHTFLSTPDGKAIAAFHLPYDTPGNLRNVVSNWQLNKNYIDHWGETEFIQFADILVKEGALISAEQYLKTIPKAGFYLHFLPFLQGMLYVGNTNQLKAEEIELIQHVADAFSTAYARYEDFNKLEAAKQQVEKTLTDLKQAQTQLVQSEKMASLGEMTAGIAHEIQNPLNFVNNFSEVSKELLDEMKTELETGNTEDAKDIADDVIQNLEKINHHGKRADAIVKSMLQHSRSSSGKKEPADINGLADEYLRLAYHGLRAKDKSFNAKFETEFDNNIGKINIISQDIGRVLVNLINNAFYAVSERKKQESNGYEPTVTVFTKKINDKIEIKVKDNGNGIPQKVLDKIFQPFFTTKPTGQGTGLGLSLAYDIITKGHGGELKVETREGEGSEFIIQIPMN